MPLLLGAPKFLAGELTLGELMQIATAFTQVQIALNWLIDNAIRLAETLASCQRVVELNDALDALDESIGRVFKALADPTRRRVFARVAGGPCSVTEIARDLPVSRPAVSQHLRILLDARLVDVRPQGRLRVYQVQTDGLAQLRQELESYWRAALTRFKDVAEGSYQSATVTTEGMSTR